MSKASDLPPEKRRLLYRATHRGFKEADLVLGEFAKTHLADMSPEEEEAFDRLLDESDREIYAWAIGREPAPEVHQTSVMQKLLAFDVSKHVPR